MILYIKNMLSKRCIIVVKRELERLNLESQCDELGIVKIDGKLSNCKWEMLKTRLRIFGLELVQDKKTLMSNQIKSLIQEVLNNESDLSEIHISSYLSKKMNMDYPTLSKIFSERNPFTLKQYVIRERVKKVKELIQKQQCNLAEISNKLHYSSTAHLCNEFKKVTGFTPKFFKQFF
jgi:YesN/AraC family two-component response regulator